MGARPWDAIFVTRELLQSPAKVKIMYLKFSVNKCGSFDGPMPLSGDRIPCKPTKPLSFNKNEEGGGGSDKSNTLCSSPTNTRTNECSLCVQWNPYTKTFHMTSQCNYCNKDGSKKGGMCPYSGTGGSGKPCYNNALSKDLDKHK